MRSNDSFPPWYSNSEPTGVEHFGQRLKSVIGEQSVASFAKGCGLEVLQLEVRSDNVPAIALYESLGFVTVRDFVTYRKPLREGPPGLPPGKEEG